MAEYCIHCMNPIGEGATVCPSCNKAADAEIPAHHLRPGTVINGKFLVGKALGEGGFGITYIGRDLNLDMKVAIKEFYPNGYVNRSNTVSPLVSKSISDDRRDYFDKGKERFLNEARTLAKFSGERGIVDVRDFFEENNTAYIIMEYLEGIDLKTYLKQHGVFSPDEIIRFLLPVMISLKKVHAQGLIHRDISPDNIMVTANGVKLLDFGAARNVSAEANKSLSVMLKPGYAPEEQYRSKGNQGPWTDIYALCATMYKCITGTVPDDATQRMYKDELRSVSSFGVNISPATEFAILKGLSVDQKNRYQNMDELLNGLQGIGYTPEAGSATPAAFAVPDTSYNQSTPAQTGEYTPSAISADAPAPTEKKKSKKPLIIGIIAAVIVIIIAVPAIIFIPEILSQNEPVDSDTTSTEEADNKNKGNTEDKDENNTEDKDEGDTEITTEGVEEPSDKPEKIELSDDLSDFTFELYGKTYSLPMKYTDFTADGWELDDYTVTEKTKISAESSQLIFMSNGESDIYVHVYNYSGNARLLKDCYIGGIEFTKGGALGCNIDNSSSEEDIIEAFGEPDNTYAYESSVTLSYYFGDEYSNCVEFYCHNTSTNISLKNYVKMPEDKTETVKEKPEYLSDYEAPDKMGSDITDFTIEADGEIYRLPCPVSALTDNGWTISSKPGYLISGGTHYCTMKKGDMELDVVLRNFSDYQTTPENCAVVNISTAYSDSAEISVPINGKIISTGMAKADIDGYIPDDFEYYEYETSSHYSYYDYDNDITAYIYIGQDNTVSAIELEHREWDY